MPEGRQWNCLSFFLDKELEWYLLRFWMNSCPTPEVCMCTLTHLPANTHTHRGTVTQSDLVHTLAKPTPISRWDPKVKSLSHVWLFVTPWTVAHQAPLSMEFSRQEYWSGLPFPSPGDLPNPGIKPGSPALQGDALPSEPSGDPPCEDLRKRN